MPTQNDGKAGMTRRKAMTLAGMACVAAVGCDHKAVAPAVQAKINPPAPVKRPPYGPKYQADRKSTSTSSSPENQDSLQPPDDDPTRPARIQPMMMVWLLLTVRQSWFEAICHYFNNTGNDQDTGKKMLTNLETSLGYSPGTLSDLRGCLATFVKGNSVALGAAKDTFTSLAEGPGSYTGTVCPLFPDSIYDLAMRIPIDPA